MERKAFTLLHDIEGSWWYRGRAVVINAAAKRGIKALPVGDVLDFGAGYGGMGNELAQLGTQVYAFEPDVDAAAAAKTRGYTEIFATVEDASARQYALVGLFDVVEHIQDDHTFISHIHSVLQPGGYVAITVPAFQFLWSVHDVHHHHFRRYTKSSMRELLEKHGFTVTYASYWNMTLFIPAVLMRLVGRSSGESALALPQVLDDLFLAIVYVESFIMRLLPLPFGTGLVFVAQKSF